MKLRDYVLNSSKYAFRSNLFVWNRFDVSLGFYEEHKGELCFNGNDGNTMLIGENVEIWFVMDDETIVFDDVYCLEKNEFWMWNKDRLCTGAVDNDGNLVFVKDGWMVRLFFEGEVVKLTTVPKKRIMSIALVLVIMLSLTSMFAVSASAASTNSTYNCDQTKVLTVKTGTGGFSSPPSPSSARH